jgi:transcriptional regulator with XRE-family HTH domain
MSESSVSRMLKGQAVPELRFLAPLAEAINMSPIQLLIETGLISPESLRALSETGPSQVGSTALTPEDAADRLGIKDEVGRQMFLGTVERLQRLEGDEDGNTGTQGGAQAQA